MSTLTVSDAAVDGKLNAVQKEAALKKIRTDPEITIILISLKVSLPATEKSSDLTRSADAFGNRLDQLGSI